MENNTSNIPTRFSNYSDVALYSMFRCDEWNQDSETYKTPQQRLLDRQEALQELANRAARDYGSKPVPVNVKDISGYGSYHPGTKEITVSKSLVTESAVLDSRGNYHYRPDSNYRSMANVYHETWHATQDQARQNPDIYIGDEQTRQDVIANMSYYIKSSPSTADLYRIQIVEKQANEYAQAKTLAAIKSTEQYYGKEKALALFQGSLTATYDKALAAARVNYNDPNIDKTLQTAINDCYYNNGQIQQNLPYSYYQVRTILVDQQLETIRNSQDPSIYQAQAAYLNAQRESIQQIAMQSTAVQAQFSEAGVTTETSAAQAGNSTTPAVTTETDLTAESNAGNSVSVSDTGHSAETTVGPSETVAAVGSDVESSEEIASAENAVASPEIAASNDSEEGSSVNDSEVAAGNSGSDNAATGGEESSQGSDNGMEM